MWDKDEFPRWSMPGLEAGIAAQRQGEDAFHRFHLRLYRSFFIESKSLIDKDNLVAVARTQVSICRHSMQTSTITCAGVGT